MSDAASPSPSTRPSAVRFSLGTLLLLVTIVCLAATLLLQHRRLGRVESKLDAAEEKLAKTEREYSALQPLSPEEVARQFENAATLGPIKTTVKDVRYSPTEDAYRVEFYWVNATSGEKAGTITKLVSNGYGMYYGSIQSKSFVDPLGGRKNGFSISVRTPSPLANE